MAITIDQLQIEIQAKSTATANGVEALATSLSKLKKAVNVKGTERLKTNLAGIQAAISQLSPDSGTKLSQLAAGLTALANVPKQKIGATTANQITAIGVAAQSLAGADFSAFSQMAVGLSALASVGKSTLTATVANNIRAVGDAVRSLAGTDFGFIQALADGLKPLETIGKSNLGSALKQLKKIPEITKGLDPATLSAFAAKIIEVTNAVRPLAVEMEKVSAGFSRLPANIQRAINANARLTKSNRSTSFGFNMMAAKIAIVYSSLRRVANIVGGWIKESNDYVENLNLFTVAMGDGAEEAQRFAEHVGEALGIDPSEWMRNQGIFNTLLTGFGVAADKSALMSKNLTQLGYDLSSFFNISFAESMQKLQSGISGELEPLRRLGYDLSQAKLEAIALSLGIDRSVSSMTQAEKAQLRYYAILTQVTTAQGDMARTLEAPANQLRILQAQATQAARALGNIFIPALNAVLPYAIAFLKVIRTVANEIANLFGFSLPQIDYSGLEGVAGYGEDAEDALGGAADAANDLKNAMLGIDELNVISSQTSGGGSGGIGGGGGGFDIELPEYDFIGGLVSSKVDEIFESMQKWAKRLLPILKPLATVIAGLWATTQLMKFAKWLKATSELFGSGGLAGNIAKVSSALTGLAVGFGIGALVSYVANIWAADTGTKELGYAITGLTVIIGGAIAVWGALSGSIGLAFAGIGLVVGAVAGLAIAQEQLLTEKVSEWFYSYSEGSITITQLADAYGKMADEIVARKQPIIDGFAAYEQGKESIAKTAQGLDALLYSVQYNTDSIKEKLPEIKAAFDTLLNQTQGTLASLRETILLSLAGATGEAFTAMGGDLAAIYGLLDETFGAADKVLKDSQTRLGELYVELESGDGCSDAIIAEILKLKGTIGSLTKDSIPEVENFQLAANTAFNGVNFENPEAVSEALAKFKEKTEAATEAINQGAAAELASITELERLAGVLGIELSPETKSLLEQYKKKITDNSQAEIDSINAQFESSASAISAGFITSMQGVAEKASADWNNLNWLEKWWNGGSEAAYVEKALTNYRNTIVTPVQNKLIEANGSIGATVAGQTDSIMDEIMEALFTYGVNGMGFYVSGFKKDIESAFKKPLEELGKSIPSGIANGVKANISGITGATGEAAKKGIEAFASAQQSGSPALKYMEQALFAMQGFKQSIERNTSLITNATKKAATDAIEAFASAQQSGSPALKYMEQALFAMQGFKQGIESNTSLIMNATKKAATDAVGAFAQGLTSAQKNVTSSLDLISQSITQPLENIISKMKGMGREIIDNLLSGINSAIPNVRKSFESMFNNVKIKMPHFTISGNFNLDPPRVPKFNVRWYADGGFPLPGELFIARESGPEMVGTMGSRTAVANNDQIVEGVSRGVYLAVRDAMRENGGNGQPIYVYMDSDQIAARVEQRKERNVIRSNGGGFATI